jgi:hypothetical protein
VTQSEKMKEPVLSKLMSMTREPTSDGDGDANPISNREKQKNAAALDLLHHRGTLVEGWPPARREDKGRGDAKAAPSGAQCVTGVEQDLTRPPHDVTVPKTAHPRSGRQ